MTPYVFILLVVVQLVSVNCKTDNFLEMCHKSDPNFNSCLLKKLRAAMPFLNNGIPNLGIPSIEPLKMPLLAANGTISDFASWSAAFKNLTIKNLSKFKIDKFDTDPSRPSGEITFVHPKINIEFDYEVNTVMWDTAILSAGKLKGKFTDIKTNVKLTLKTVIKNEVKYFAVDTVNVHMEIGDGSMKAISKNPQNQAMDDTAVQMFNSNPQHYFDLILPLAAEFAEGAVRLGGDRVLSLMPADQWLPE